MHHFLMIPYFNQSFSFTVFLGLVNHLPVPMASHKDIYDDMLCGELRKALRYICDWQVAI